MNGIHARLAAFGGPAPGIARPPEPRSIGSLVRGRQICEGRFVPGGMTVAAADRTIWDLPSQGAAFEAMRHGFLWLDDLAAAGDRTARRRAQAWTLDWIRLFGRGHGPGWSPELVGRRVIRWLQYGDVLLRGMQADGSAAFRRALAQQTRFLARRWQGAPPGLPRFEALSALIHAGLAQDGLESRLDPALAALERICDREIDEGGALASRNPEELLEVLGLLTWTASALETAGRAPRPAHHAAIRRVAPTLRALRHADGGLARFHGGGRGPDGRLDRALAEARVRPVSLRGLAMGYARLSAGRTSVIVDAAAPPATCTAHASTLAFELTSGRRPVVISCGAGAGLGRDWARAARATQSHSTLAISGFSSSRFGRTGRDDADPVLAERPGTVEARRDLRPEGHVLTTSHDGYAPTHGLIHRRQLLLDPDGRALSGEDRLAAETEPAREAFATAMARTMRFGIDFAIRFHLHPDVQADIDGGGAVCLALKSGEVWEFRHDGAAELSLAPSVHLERDRPEPRATKQIVLSARVIDYASVIRWSLAKAGATPRAPRDLDREDECALALAPWTRREETTEG